MPETTPEKKPESKPAVPLPVLDPVKVAAAHQQYGEQRKPLPDTEIMKKIWSLPRWKLWSRPMDFRKARFQSLDHCVQFVASESVRSDARWTQYPWFQHSPEHGSESVAAEIDSPDTAIEHTERWVLFQSGQFVHNMAVDRIARLGKRIHVLEILDVITALYEFTARMADRKIFTNHVGIAVELQVVAGRELAWREELDLGRWAQDDDIGIDTTYTPRSCKPADGHWPLRQQLSFTRTLTGKIRQGKISRPYSGNGSDRPRSGVHSYISFGAGSSCSK